ncbi:hypothetical protein KY290_007264 [Solanum tuberosum]|uniref:Uncharacterized protein n=1 Tax=Solanum tuberosum TaxID=4113 RepID=A0ABQ7W524_SOLTU|nr:hypothetical protein KY290_007264 [Solanum tuberosum]
MRKLDDKSENTLLINLTSKKLKKKQSYTTKINKSNENTTSAEDGKSPMAKTTGMGQSPKTKQQ